MAGNIQLVDYFKQCYSRTICGAQRILRGVSSSLSLSLWGHRLGFCAGDIAKMLFRDNLRWMTDTDIVFILI